MGCGSSVVAGGQAHVTVPEFNAKRPPVKGSIQCHVWTGDSADGTLTFPERSDGDFGLPSLESRAPLAICISGGGFRAASLGLGWLRALHQLGVLSKAQYLCVCSGSSWVAAPLAFQRAAPLDAFLGPHMPPEECGLAALEQVGERGRSFAAALADAAPLRAYLRELLPDAFDRDWTEQEACAWSSAMAEAFLGPFELGDVGGSVVAQAGTRGAVHTRTQERAAALGRSVYTASPNLPYLVICQSVLLPSDPALYYPAEWSPLYGGMPVRCAATEPQLGPGWVETLGLNATLAAKPAAPPGPGGIALPVVPNGPASLGEAIGVSSAYCSYKWALGSSKGGAAAHRVLGFNTAQCFDMQSWASSRVSMTDGGGNDYCAIYPALRRRVPCVIALVAGRTAPQDIHTYSRYMKELAALFGRWPGDPADIRGLPPPEYNKQRQVFPPAGFDALFAALQDRFAAGEPPVHVATYEVAANPWMGVPGGWRVRVMWVVNQRQMRWEAELPTDTRRRLQDDRTGLGSKVAEAANPLDAATLREFPLVSTFSMNYTPQLVSLMAAHAGWMLTESAAEVAAMLQPPPPPAAVAAGEEGQGQEGGQ